LFLDGFFIFPVGEAKFSSPMAARSGKTKKQLANKPRQAIKHFAPAVFSVDACLLFVRFLLVSQRDRWFLRAQPGGRDG
jgi:hypothetical protein